MKYICPSCGGLIGDDLKCKKCHAVYDTAEELIIDGMCEMSDKASKIVLTIGVTQEFWDMMGLHERYENELEKLEIKNWSNWYEHKRPY